MQSVADARRRSTAYFCCCCPPCLSLPCLLESPCWFCCGVGAGDAGFCVSLEDGVFVTVYPSKNDLITTTYFITAIGSNADNKVGWFLPRGIFSAALFQKGEALHTEFTDEGRGVTKRESPELFQHIIKPSPRALD